MDPNRDLVLSTLDKVIRDGKTIWPVQALDEMGYDRTFVEPLAETYCDDPDDQLQTLCDPQSEKRIEHMRGVHELDMLQALGELVKADTSLVTAFGRGTRSRLYGESIRKALEGCPIE